MNPLVFWNELSERPLAATIADANERMNNLVDAIAALRRASPGTPAPCLRSHRPLDGTILCDGHTVAEWQIKAERTRRSFYLQLATRSPLLSSDDVADSWNRYGCSDCWAGDESALGLRAAWAVDELAVSLDSHERWRRASLPVEIEILGDEGESSRHTAVIRHLVTFRHVQEHADWLAERVRRSVVDGRDLWERRRALLPNLDLCREVERQLGTLDAGSDQFRQVLVRLFRLDAVIAAWAQDEPRKSVNPEFLPPFKCTPETPQTLKEEEAEHTATRPSGEHHLFKWHVRFTPGAGRLFFDVDAVTGRGIVGYIGVKKGDRLT
jgi:hypothetical protein